MIIRCNNLKNQLSMTSFYVQTNYQMGRFNIHFSMQRISKNEPYVIRLFMPSDDAKD